VSASAGPGQQQTASSLVVASSTAATAATIAFIVWLFNMIIGDFGDHSFIGFAVIPLIIAAGILWLPLNVFFAAAKSWRARRQRGEPRKKQAIVTGITAIVSVAWTAACFHFFVPEYFTPPHEHQGAFRNAARDFTTPWGARMLAIEYRGSQRYESLLKGHTLWVAETELTRAHYAALVGQPQARDAALPMTAIEAGAIEKILEGANRSSLQGPIAGGRFRLPTSYEAQSYSGDWWITQYPKRIYRCDDRLSAATDASQNALGVRGTTTNAAEIVISLMPSFPPAQCATLGSVPPLCGFGSSDGGGTGRWKTVTYIRCATVENPERLLRDPLVGMRLVYSADPPASGFALAPVTVP